MESGPDEKHTYTHFSHKGRNKQNREKNPKAIQKHSKSFLVINEALAARLRKMIYGLPRKDGG